MITWVGNVKENSESPTTDKPTILTYEVLKVTSEGKRSDIFTLVTLSYWQSPTSSVVEGITVWIYTRHPGRKVPMLSDANHCQVISVVSKIYIVYDEPCILVIMFS